MAHIDAERVLERGQFDNRLKVVYGAVFADPVPVEALEYCTLPAGQGPTVLPDSGWKPFSVMGRWGEHDVTTWFRMRAVLPKSYKGARVAARIRLAEGTYVEDQGWIQESGEALAYVNGVPRQGLDRNHHILWLADKAKGGERFDIALEGVSSTWLKASHVLSQADIAIFRPAVWDFYWDAKVVFDLTKEWDDQSSAYRRLFEVLARSLGALDVTDPSGARLLESIETARKILHAGLKEFPWRPRDGRLAVVGHSHIDTAWLWPLRETQRKVGRTWGTVLELMKQYREFRFSASQPQLYAYCKEHHPETWQGIRKRVREGRWELCGATWVEQDSQMPCGEALVRQFLYGNRFYEAEFGKRSRTAWLPDAFGFPWSLPQIMVKSGIETFYTNKIQWGRFTKFPYNYFYWQGADGSRIRSVIGSTKNYNGFMTPEDVRQQWAGFKQNHITGETVYSYGWGDGGGGPTMEMVETGKRLRNMAGSPACVFSGAEEAFDRMKAQAPEAALPVYNDELYLEYHRGCQTTQARTKWNNRKGEVLLKNAEWLSSLALLAGGGYDAERLAQAWRILLTHQFHDILPGSSIAQVYADAEENYAEMRALAGQTLSGAMRCLEDRIDTSGEGAPIIVFNPSSWPRTDVAQVEVDLPKGAFHVAGPDGVPVPCQRVGDSALLFEVYDVPPLGYAVYRVLPGAVEAEPSGGLKARKNLIENDALRIRLDACGRFTSVYDKAADREVLAPGAKGNVMQFFEDFPHANDAWDIDHNFEDKTWEAGKASSIEVIEEGPVRAVVRVAHTMGQSAFTQDITLYAVVPRADVAVRADWHEQHVLWKVAFPVDVLCNRASYDIQYATIERPTHHSTEFDRARFENTCHHWVDLSEGDYGVSLLNDCKYGCDVKDNVLRLSLLRSPAKPDLEADRGEHEFVYALYPHGGDWREGAVQQGYAFNQPLTALPAKAAPGPLPAVYAFASVDVDHVILDAVKKAEDSEALILRVYEAYGQRGPVSIHLARPPKRVTECDLMEEHDVAATVQGAEIRLQIKPYEIRTLKVRF